MLLLRRGCEGLTATPQEPLEGRSMLKNRRRSRDAQEGLWGSRGLQPPPSSPHFLQVTGICWHIGPVTGLGQRDP